MSPDNPKILALFLTAVKTLFCVSFSILLFCQIARAQGNCEGEDILKQLSCSGDSLSDGERQIARLVNDYRKENNLVEVSISENLSLVANRHVLDISKNIGHITHSWSDCTYSNTDSKTWDCLFKAPKRFNPEFSGVSFENVYYTSFQKVLPASALEAWKRSPLHNSTILNQNSFKKFNWSSIGVAIDGGYAAIWFIAEGSNAKPRVEKIEIKGLGVTFSEATKGLTSTLSINNVSSSIDSKKWVGTSKDKSVVLEMYGKTRDIAEGKMSLRLRLGKAKTLSPNNRRILGTFVQNLAPNWIQRNLWLDSALKNLRKSARVPQRTTVKNISIEIAAESDGFLAVTIKPNPNTAAFEVK